jgi:hypothetical protein
MEMLIACFDCAVADGMPRPFTVHYFEDRAQAVSCPHGHSMLALPQGMKFECLMESGGLALLQNFTLEAVGAFSAARERFYEFALKVLARDAGLDTDGVTNLFKGMSKQTERQIGALMALHSIKFHRRFAPDTTLSATRNDVLHKGIIPTPAEAREYANGVYDEIRSLVDDLHEGCEFALREELGHDMTQRTKGHAPHDVVVSTSGTNLFNISRPSHPDFEVALHGLSQGNVLRFTCTPDALVPRPT